MYVEVIIRDKELYPDGLTRGSERASAFDLRSTVDAEIKPGDTLMIDTGLSIWGGAAAANDPYDGDDCRLTGLVLPRSGLGATRGLILGNTAGLIDDDYQGYILVAAWNRNMHDRSVFIKRGDRIAQYAFVPVIIPTIEVVEEFTQATARGDGGFGSTGVK